MSRRDEILSVVRETPALPGGAAAAVRLLQDPEADPREIVRELERDVALSANVLRVANSASYGGSRRVATVRDALGRLGQARVFQIVVAVAIGPTAGRPVKGYDLSAGKLWEHSLAVAVGTGPIARELGIEEPRDLFVAGLLHDVGKILLGNFVEVDVAALLELTARERIPFVEAERRLLGVDHAEVGAALLEQWGLPDSIVEACRWHHDPEQAPAVSLAVDVVHLSDALSLAAGIGLGSDGLQSRVSSAVVLRRGMDRKRTERAAVGLMTAMADSGEVLAMGREK